MSELDNIIRLSLTSFAEEALDGSWNGRREREAVSLYVLGHLIRHVSDSGFLRSAAQIGIEFPVPQLDEEVQTELSGRSASKDQVCKDVVIWPEPRMTCWDDTGQPTVSPSAILEWKFNTSGIYQPDVDWLRRYSRVHPEFIGYAVSGNPPGAKFRLSCMRLEAGDASPEWVHIA